MDNGFNTRDEPVSVKERQTVLISFVTGGVKPWMVVFQAFVTPGDDLIFNLLMLNSPINVKPQAIESVNIGKSN
jgi:hypothetical protein